MLKVQGKQMIPDEWQDSQFLQELMEQEQNQMELAWASAPGRWANLQWEPSEVIPDRKSVV